MPKIKLSAPGQAGDSIILPEAMIGDSFAEGESVRLLVTNTSGTIIRRITIGVEGTGANNVSLAAEDENGDPRVWAAPGKGIVAFTGKLHHESSAAFWAKSIYEPEDDASTLPFEFVVVTVSEASFRKVD